MELLVVIGIIAILISLLATTMGRVRMHARTTQCLSNLRQIGAAALVYASRYDNFTVPGYRDPAVNPSGNGEGADTENYATMLVNEKLIPAPDVKSIGAEVRTESSVFRCPDGVDWGAEQFTTASGFNPQPNGREDTLGAKPMRVISKKSGLVIDTWYGVNLQTNNADTYFTPMRRLPSNNSGNDAWRLPRYGEIKDPARMVMLYDGIFFNVSYDADRINARHGNKTQTNLLFFDGHAATFRTEDLPGGMGPNPSGTDRFTNAALGASPLLMWRLNGK